MKAMARATYTDYLTRPSEGHSLKLRRHGYSEKREQIANGENPVFFAPEFIQYLLDKQNIDTKMFSAHIGRSPDYFSTNLFNDAHNDGSRFLPKFMQEIMARITGKTEEGFWLKRTFKASDAESLTVDLSAPIDDIVKRYEKAGGRQIRAQREDEKLSATLRRIYDEAGAQLGR